MKDFNVWNDKKKILDRKDKKVMFYEREVWWFVAGINVGVEIDGKHEMFLRPGIILRKFNMHMTIIIPVTTQFKENKYYFVTSSEDKKEYRACLSQIKSISSKRLFRKIGTIKKDSYYELLQKIIDTLKGSL
jgi:mRNA-degrading endonuclease toxin of MazEF toxin-antitoxin module